MNKPLIIRCNLMYPAKVINELRKDIQKQVNEGLVILPPGLELAEVNVELLEHIKAEIDMRYWGNTDSFGAYRDCLEIIDKHIAELKGKNKQTDVVVESYDMKYIRYGKGENK